MSVFHQQNEPQMFLHPYPQDQITCLDREIKLQTQWSVLHTLSDISKTQWAATRFIKFIGLVTPKSPASKSCTIICSSSILRASLRKWKDILRLLSSKCRKPSMQFFQKGCAFISAVSSQRFSRVATSKEDPPRFRWGLSFSHLLV